MDDFTLWTEIQKKRADGASWYAIAKTSGLSEGAFYRFKERMEKNPPVPGISTTGKRSGGSSASPFVASGDVALMISQIPGANNRLMLLEAWARLVREDRKEQGQ